MNPRKRNRGNRIEIALNNHVTLRVQHDYPLDEKDITKLNESYNRSLLYLDTAQVELKKIQNKLKSMRVKSSIPEEFVRHHQHMFDMLNGHFKIDTNVSVRKLTKHLHTISAKLQEMRFGLYAETDALQLSHISKKNEKKYQTFFGCVLGGYVRPDRDRIYLNLNHLQSADDDTMCRYLIHECSHKFVDTQDFDGAYYNDVNAKPANDKLSQLLTWYYQDDSHKKVIQLTREMRLRHADSITNFVVDVAKHALQFQSAAKKNMTYPDRELIKTNVSRLFSGIKPVSRAEEVINIINTTTKVVEITSGVAIVATLGLLAYRMM